MEIHLQQFEKLTIEQLRELTKDYERVSKELKFVKMKYPKAKEELESEGFDLDKFLEELK